MLTMRGLELFCRTIGETRLRVSHKGDDMNSGTGSSGAEELDKYRLFNGSSWLGANSTIHSNTEIGWEEMINATETKTRVRGMPSGYSSLSLAAK